MLTRIKSQASHGTAAGQWSGKKKPKRAVKAYKKAGGGYRGGGKSKTSLAKWSKQKWRTNQVNHLLKQEKDIYQQKQLNLYQQENMQEQQLRKEEIKHQVNNLVNNQSQ